MTALTDLKGAVLERYYYSPYGQVEVAAETYFGDYDADGSVDSDDADDLCTSGCTCEFTSSVSGDCRVFDFDCDGDLDETDQNTLRTLYQGLSTDMQNRRIPSTTSSPTGNPFGHQGLVLDVEINSCQNRARQYNPKLKRFMQRDPLGYVDGANLYEYVRSGPTASIDWLGLAAGAASGGGAGGISGGAAVLRAVQAIRSALHALRASPTSLNYGRVSRAITELRDLLETLGVPSARANAYVQKFWRMLENAWRLRKPLLPPPLPPLLPDDDEPREVLPDDGDYPDTKPDIRPPKHRIEPRPGIEPIPIKPPGNRPTKPSDIPDDWPLPPYNPYEPWPSPDDFDPGELPDHWPWEGALETLL